MKYILAILAGALLPFAFAPFHGYFFAFVGVALLFWLWSRANAWQATLQGWLFGLGFFGVGVSWVYVSIHTFGQTPMPIALLVTGLFIGVLALFPATQGLFANFFFKRASAASRCLLVYPASWVLWELLRTFLFTGFPWLLLGYTQLDTPLRGIAPWFGVYGVSLAVTLIAGILVVLFNRSVSKRIRGLSLILFLIIFIAPWPFAYHHYTKTASKPIQVSLIQGNIAQTIKWEPQHLAHILKIYLRLTRAHLNSRLIIWPEAAIPIFPQEIPSYMQLLKQLTIQNNNALLVGAPIMNLKTRDYYNAALMIGETPGIYRKRHLVPFGEYLPLQSWFNWFIKYFKIPMSNFTAGPKLQTPLRFDHIPIATFICYEIAFPFEVLDFTKGTQLMVTITDDSWFGHSWALAQHAQMAQMRALELGRYLLLCANTGITAIINPEGRVVAHLPTNQQGVLTAKVTAMQGQTPLMIWGYKPLAIAIVILLILAFFL